ncbi:uncharacterized protein LOC110722847 [Chenopodium quinoa]|uniref:uncharacterized protein LOC110722847 n=1 Tax=Chenopodium quinoa TaxID=63459 RepID=UPI000B781497|nr:uncharacterized protein LOC110722847 [Chenopodium quinoa]
MSYVNRSILIFFTLLFFFFTFSNAFQDLGSSSSSQGVINNRRSVAENTTEGNSSLKLAAHNTYRRDPLNHFHRYTGGWNITDKHYWASVAFTAVPFFVVALVWFLIFGLSLICTCLYFCCCRKAPYGYSRVCYALSLICLVLFTIAAIIGCIFLYTGQQKFHNSTATTLRYVVDQANYTVENLNNVSHYLDEAKNIGVGQMRLPETLQNKISDIQTKMSSAANTLESRTNENSKKIRRVLDFVRLALIILAAVMLLLAFVGFLLSIFGVQCLVYTLVIVGWLLVTITFILCGVFLVLHNVVADTCISMDQWVQNPTSHTALDDILPCVDNATAQETLLRSKEVTSQLVGLVNLVIGNIANTNVPPNTPPPLYFNQSGPSVPNLCNPYNSNLSNRTCASGEVNFNNASQVWKNYVCEIKKVSGNEICTTTGRLTPTMYSQMNSAENVGYALNHYTPFLVNLQDCTFVRSTFSYFSANHCPGLRKYTQWIYIGLVLVSAAVMFSLIFWVIYARERRHRVYTKQFMAGH